VNPFSVLFSSGPRQTAKKPELATVHSSTFACFTQAQWAGSCGLHHKNFFVLAKFAFFFKGFETLLVLKKSKK
jgi:hypothetical protein